MSEAHDDHGSTPAAWTVVVFTVVAFTVGTLGVMMANWMVFWVGVAILVLGAIVGKIMAKAGLGKKRPEPANT